MPKLLHQRAIANTKIGYFRDAIRDCTNAMENCDTEYSKNLRLRANCYMDMRKFQKAISDYELLYKIHKSNEMENQLKKAKYELKRFQSDNYYDILDVDKTASTDEIRKAFKKLALIHHPDKHADAPNYEKIEQQEQFKKINNAHEVLSNPMQRDAYDRKCRRHF